MNFEKNYELKQDLINRLKDLINNNKSISKNYSEFKDIREKWFQIGPVSNQKNDDIWNNFQHHIKNFYDYLAIPPAVSTFTFSPAAVCPTVVPEPPIVVPEVSWAVAPNRG